jgi:hypothetical protein
MLQLVTIDLSVADMLTFGAHESRVLRLLNKYGGKVEFRVRALDGTSETHLLAFPDAVAFNAFRIDPQRLESQDEWIRSGARVVSAAVRRIDG